MKLKKINFCVIFALAAFCLFGCGENFLLSDDTIQTFSTIEALGDYCNEDTDGQMFFVKSTATMYVCSGNEWVAMQTPKHKCHSEDLVDGNGIAIVCDGDTIGVVNNGKDADMDAIQEEIEDRGCRVVDTTRNYEEAVIKVTIQCGDAQTEMKIPFTEENKNLANVYKKHVVVRFPIQASKETNSENLYEELWKNFKGGENAELTVMDLDGELNATGKMFLKDLFASASKSFVTIEETNEKFVQYRVVRLEGDLDITNLSSPIVQLRTKLNLKQSKNVNSNQSKVAKGKSFTNVIYNAYVDLSEASDTIVIDFLTDYKAARVKNLVDAGAKFADASKQANKELATALYLENKDSKEYPTFEHFVPEVVGLAEHFNSVVWVMALIDQKDKTPGFNVTYNAFRDLFAKYGNLLATIKTTYAGREQDMFFVDFIALLIDANFAQRICWQGGDSECDNNQWRGTNAVYYDVVQKGFVRTYELSIDGLVPYAGYSDKLFKSDVEGGYFRYFTYDETSKIWWPLGLWAGAVATLEKVKCDATTVGNTFLYSFEGLDDNAVCIYDGRDYTWIDTVNVCLGRNKGDKGSAVHRSEDDYGYYVYTIGDYECVKKECNPSASSCDDVELVPVWESSSSVGSSSSSFEDQGGKTPEELANDPSSKLYLGTCNETKQGSEKPFNINNAELATTTGYETYVCDGSKWRLKTEADERYETCTKSMMKLGVVKALPGSQYMKCDYLDNENKYEWIAAEMRDNALGEACHYGNVDKKVVAESGYEYVCETVEDLDNWGNHIHKWRETTIDEYCVGDRVFSTTQKVADEELGELTFNEKCEFQSSVYVRNKTAENSTEWISNWTFAENNIPAMGYVYVIFMEGYTDNELFSCANYCDHYSIDRVKSQLAVTSSSSEQQKLLNIICNMGEYKRVSAGAYAVDTIAFEVEVQLSESEIKKTYVASAKRKDWHVATLNDIFGECNRDKMFNQSSLSVYNRTNYKCDYIESNSGSYYTWREASELDAYATLGICTYARDGEVVKVNDLYYECEAHDINSSASRDWSEYSESAYLNKNLGECDADYATTSTSDIKKLNGNRYKCSVHEGDAKWVDANVDYTLGNLCTYDKAHADKKTVAESNDGKLYVCDEQSSHSTWVETSVADVCEYFKEPLRYNSSYGTGDNDNTAISDNRIMPCSDTDTAMCAYESKKFVCNIDLGYKTLSYVSEDDGNTWKDVQNYCGTVTFDDEQGVYHYSDGAHAYLNSCEFANNKWGENLDTLYRVYEQTQYYVYNNSAWNKATNAQEYCEARFPGHGEYVKCLFEAKMYYWCKSQEMWKLLVDGCPVR